MVVLVFVDGNKKCLLSARCDAIFGFVLFVGCKYALTWPYLIQTTIKNGIIVDIQVVFSFLYVLCVIQHTITPKILVTKNHYNITL